eukprot:TRINITY_DN10646_c0_g1_i1.p2 TRINITY_DN10646_c0_g1~~TRINITY_DN10646_c0_g1_i1.p2  ORF type:complete len:227 (+),score=-20.46 TRINITY_DN10646_c0_g1_i1:672-1352(+)
MGGHYALFSHPFDGGPVVPYKHQDADSGIRLRPEKLAEGLVGAPSGKGRVSDQSNLCIYRPAGDVNEMSGGTYVLEDVDPTACFRGIGRHVGIVVEGDTAAGALFKVGVGDSAGEGRCRRGFKVGVAEAETDFCAAVFDGLIVVREQTVPTGDRVVAADKVCDGNLGAANERCADGVVVLDAHNHVCCEVRAVDAEGFVPAVPACVWRTKDSGSRDSDSLDVDCCV